jgi:hypothetical protein
MRIKGIATTNSTAACPLGEGGRKIASFGKIDSVCPKFVQTAGALLDEVFKEGQLIEFFGNQFGPKGAGGDIPSREARSFDCRFGGLVELAVLQT